MNKVEIFLKGLTAKQLAGLILFLADKENKLQSFEVSKMFAKDEYSNTSEVTIADVIKIEGSVQGGFDIVIEVLESIPYAHQDSLQKGKELEKATIHISFITELFQSVNMFLYHEDKEIK